MTSRTSRRCRRAIGAGVAVLALTGCTLHPGSAAVVNGTAISQSRVDDLVLAACDFTKASRAGSQSGSSKPATSTEFLRHVLLQDLISFQLTAKAARLMHLTVTPADIAKAGATVRMPPGLGSSDRSLLTTYFYASARSQLEQALIGAHLSHPAVTSSSDIAIPGDLSKVIPAAAHYLASFTARQHVVVNPMDGSWNGQSLVDQDGSLSAPVSSAALRWITLRSSNSSSANGLPPTQVCG